MKYRNLIERATLSLRRRTERAARDIALSFQHKAQAAYRQIPGIADEHVLYAVYDLNEFPASFDFLWFLAAAEVERQRRRLSGVHVIVSLFDRPYVHPKPVGHPDHVSETDMLWRVNTMLVPCCSLLRSCISYSLSQHAIATARMLAPAKHVWPNSGSAWNRQTTLIDVYKTAVSGLAEFGINGTFHAPPQAVRFIREWKENFAADRQLVTITLREYHGSPARNSRISDWLKFADGLDPTRFKVVFIPDTFNALTMPQERLRGYEILKTAAHSVPLRLALYEESYLNLSVSSGPFSLAILGEKCRYILFKLTVDGLRGSSSIYLEDLGFPFNTTPRFAADHQAWIWQDDTADAIRQAFDHMRDRIDRAPNSQERAL
ncbi:MAG: hypothetical protein ACK4NA_15455 [Alphaproteobacteria bacterium]